MTGMPWWLLLIIVWWAVAWPLSALWLGRQIRRLDRRDSA